MFFLLHLLWELGVEEGECCRFVRAGVEPVAVVLAE
jgi:hypothetical protein